MGNRVNRLNLVSGIVYLWARTHREDDVFLCLMYTELLLDLHENILAGTLGLLGHLMSIKAYQ